MREQAVSVHYVQLHVTKVDVCMLMNAGTYVLNIDKICQPTRYSLFYELYVCATCTAPEALDLPDGRITATPSCSSPYLYVVAAARVQAPQPTWTQAIYRETERWPFLWTQLLLLWRSDRMKK